MWQVMCEEGYCWPQSMVVASDSHSNMYGGIGCLGTPVVRTDAASIWATGKTWWQVPPVTKVTLKGSLRRGVSGKDVIITLCGRYNKDEVLNHAVEFSGEGIASLSIDERLTISNMTTEWGALVGLFPTDERTLNWLKQRISIIQARNARLGLKFSERLTPKRLESLEQNLLKADTSANYAGELVLDLDKVVPHISGPNSVKKMEKVSEVSKRRIPVHKAYLVSCVNSRLEDIRQAAAEVSGKRVHSGVELYLSAASSEVESACREEGVWQTLVDAGAKELPPGCGPCIGLGAGLLRDGEVGISATNRNFKGRMGSRDADCYLASPAVVAASAVAGYITLPEAVSAESFAQDNQPATQPLNLESKREEVEKVKEVLLEEGFPERVEGQLVFCHQDNLNTDGIYPGKYTYREDISPEQQAQVAMENYDPNFSTLVHSGDILVGGFNFGTGSSREQAATALKYKGIPVLFAGSFSETYKRNAINNGFLVLETPQLSRDLKKLLGEESLTVKTTIHATVDFVVSKIHLKGAKEPLKSSYAFSPVGSIAQQLVILGGLNNWVTQQIRNKK